MTIEVSEIRYPSAVNAGLDPAAIKATRAGEQETVFAKAWFDPDAEPKAIIQILHGMAEHIERYDEFARFLVQRGFAVVGQDHIGHGKSVTDGEQYGHMPIKNGIDILIANTQTLRERAQRRFGAELPYFIFGHSMGSYLARCYLARHGEGLAGAVLCGTGMPAPVVSKAGNLLCHAIAALRGETYRSKLVDKLAAGGFADSIEGAESPEDWLSYDKENVRRYQQDELCGFMFSVGGYAAVTGMAHDSSTRACVASYPKDLPLFYIAGAEDPVGDCGKGVERAAQLARSAGVRDVSVKLYPHMRHEILNEADRLQVMTDVADWACEKLKGTVSEPSKSRAV